jgi:Raf kinase inhibitor-like YbhB/YbcL family protein
MADAPAADPRHDRPMHRRVVALVALLATLGSCGGGAASPGVTSRPEVPMSGFVLSSTAFAPGAPIPRRHTCDGEDVSPDLAWSGAPDGTGALVLLVDDPDARGWVHWIALDLPGAASGSLATAASRSPTAPAQGTNDFRRAGWGGPCPPSGTHRYVFTLYALARPLGLSGEPNGATVRQALARAEVLGTAVLEGTYRRGG